MVERYYLRAKSSHEFFLLVKELMQLAAPFWRHIVVEHMPRECNVLPDCLSNLPRELYHDVDCTMLLKGLHSTNEVPCNVVQLADWVSAEPVPYLVREPAQIHGYRSGWWRLGLRWCTCDMRLPS